MHDHNRAFLPGGRGKKAHSKSPVECTGKDVAEIPGGIIGLSL